MGEVPGALPCRSEGREVRRAEPPSEVFDECKSTAGRLPSEDGPPVS
jgi:hypothetical protein